jgi:murein DD-endopeptidase MepM/ murein hydrolase activator NlpD
MTRGVCVTVATLAVFGAADAEAQSRIAISPAQPSPGSIVRLSLTGMTADDSVLAISGTMADEALHFRKSPAGTWRAIGPVPVDAVGEVNAVVFVQRSSGSVDTLNRSVVIPKPKPGKGRASALAVSPRFTRPLDAETQARVDRENAIAREIGRRAHDSPPMWTAPFLRPRAAVVTSRFGSGRMFNGTLTSRHLGVDFRGAVGEPIRAANRGVVALVDNFFLAGNVVYIDHGGGVVTGYFHMSKPLVAAGDTVARGQQIGLVGATGRVTGPHLHWTARYGATTVNPLDLVTLGSF